MKIKIGNFNFINSEPNEITNNSIKDQKLICFYLDGKEDTLFVDYDNFFENENNKSLNFKRELLEKYRIVTFPKEVNNQINDFIKQKSANIFTEEYSRYDLYNKIELKDIINLNKNKEYNFAYQTNFVKDIENNRIKVGEFIFNPYTEEVTNLQEQYECGELKNAIKTNLILLEIENNQAPEFVNTVLKINDFMKDKKAVNVSFKNGEKIKIEPELGSLLDSLLRLRDNKFEVSYKTENAYKKEFGTKENIRLEDIKGISYGKEFLEINPETLTNLKEQIAHSTADKFNFKIDEIKENIYGEYKDYLYDCQKDINKSNIPYDIKNALKELNKINLKDTPSWYSDKLDSIFERYILCDSLANADTPEEAMKFAKELDDNELIDIINEDMLKEYEENEEEESL